MIKEEKKNIEDDFIKKYPEVVLTSWGDSHNKITKIINENNYKIGVEIGVAYGGHSTSILETTNVDKLYGIDPYMNYDAYKGDTQCFENTKINDLHDFVKLRMSFYDNRFELVRKLSHECSDMFENESLDFVYIDGNHYEEYVKRDIEIWWDKVKKGGILSGHDYNHPSFPYVTTSVNDFFSKLNKEVNYLESHVWCVYK